MMRFARYLAHFFLTSILFSPTAFADLVPNAVIDNLLKSYNEEEIRRIQLDLKNIREKAFWGKVPVPKEMGPTYFATAGAPGSRKSTTIEHLRQTEIESQAIYIDPDQAALKDMIHTYRKELTQRHIYEARGDYKQVLSNAYAKWRDASNYIANTLLNEAFEGHYSIVHGTTSTGEAVGGLLAKLKIAGYKIDLILCAAPDAVRIAANEARINHGFYQVTAEDFVTKGQLFPRRMPIYFQYADKITLVWSNAVDDVITSAANYERDKEDRWTLSSIDRNRYAQFCEYYGDFRRADKSLPSWSALGWQ